MEARGAATVACLFGGRLAVVGEARGAPAAALLDRESGVHTLARDGDYLYAAGFAAEDVDGGGDEEWIWHIERTADLSVFKLGPNDSRIVVYSIQIPSAVRVAVQVVDGFGYVRNDWPVEIVGVAAGQGTVGPVEVLAGQYTVKTSVFGKDFTQTVLLRSGEAQTVTVQVPTARLSVEVIDEGRALVGQVESVEVAGPTPLTFAAPPRDVEVLAGQYTVRVRAFGREAQPPPQ